MRKLEGRWALVTGASRGIGRAAALAFAREGAALFLAARDIDRLEAVAAEIRAIGGTAVPVATNLSDTASRDALALTVAQHAGRLDIFLANAGILGPQKPIDALTVNDWTDLFEINVLANFHLLGLLHPLLARSYAARVIFMSSYAASMAMPGNGGYAATKAMLEAGLRAYAAENASTRLRANIVNPGGVRTDMRAEFRPDEDPAILPVPEDLGPMFVELADPALSANGATFVYPEWRKAQG